MAKLSFFFYVLGVATHRLIKSFAEKKLQNLNKVDLGNRCPSQLLLTITTRIGDLVQTDVSEEVLKSL